MHGYAPDPEMSPAPLHRRPHARVKAQPPAWSRDVTCTSRSRTKESPLQTVDSSQRAVEGTMIAPKDAHPKITTNQWVTGTPGPRSTPTTRANPVLARGWPGGGQGRTGGWPLFTGAQPSVEADNDFWPKNYFWPAGPREDVGCRLQVT